MATVSADQLKAANTEHIDVELAQDENETSRGSGCTRKTRSLVSLSLACVAVLFGGWAIVMTILFVGQLHDAKSSTVPRSNDLLGIAALSHMNVVVDDVNDAADYYEAVLGFLPASNADGPMNYPNITLESFCLDAGFADGVCQLDILFMKHPTLNIYLELFNYITPEGNRIYPMNRPNDVGGIRHVALEVLNATETYFNLLKLPHQGEIISTVPESGPLALTPFPYTFFYWRDRYGVIWEFEQGRPVQYYTVAGITG